jgi:hypothetical protein
MLVLPLHRRNRIPRERLDSADLGQAVHKVLITEMPVAGSLGETARKGCGRLAGEPHKILVLRSS